MTAIFHFSLGPCRRCHSLIYMRICSVYIVQVVVEQWRRNVILSATCGRSIYASDSAQDTIFQLQIPFGKNVVVGNSFA